MTANTIVCQAALPAKGGLKDAHFMRYVAFTFSSPTELSDGVLSWYLALLYGED